MFYGRSIQESLPGVLHEVTTDRVGAQVRPEVIQPELREVPPSGTSNTVALLRIDHQVEGLTRFHQLLH